MRSLFGNLHSAASRPSLTGPGRERLTWGERVFWFLLMGLAGGLQALSLAWPWRGWVLPGVAPGEPSGWLQIVSLALLVLALRRARAWREAVWCGWVFAAAWLVGSFWWLFVSMHTYGGLAAWMAVLAVAALAGALALIYAAAAGALFALRPSAPWCQAFSFAALWTLAELIRGRWFTGFPWGAGGYAQVDLMAAWAPWVGMYGMGAIAALLAYALALAVPAAWGGLLRRLLRSPSPVGVAQPGGRRGGVLPALGRTLAGAVLLALLGSVVLGALWRDLGRRDTAAAGELSVWLLQGNIPQNQKFETGTGIATALAWYPAQVAQAAEARHSGRGPDLVVAPETAIPVLPQQLSAEFWEPLFASLETSTAGEDAGLGWMFGIPLGSFETGYTNSAWALSPAALKDRAGAFPGQRFYRYNKQHLVPFGEFIPPLFRWFTKLMNIPLGDFARGALPQPTWPWAGQRIAPNICYEDLFGEELAQSFGDAALAPTVLINLSNIGWFGDTVAIDQHLHISRLRALELGRPMLRATNTGATAVIDHTGRVTHRLPRLTRDRLEASVQGRSGLTPYAAWASRWGLWPVWGACLAVLLLALAGRAAGAAAPLGRSA